MNTYNTKAELKLATDDQKLRAQQLLRRALKDLELVSRLLDTQEAGVLQRVRSASRDVKIAEAQLR
jgi:hypothetical protein